MFAPRFWFALISLAATTLSIAADPALFQDLNWRFVGPFRGGRVLAVAGDPGQPNHFYFGSVNGGVWETKDAGRTWQPIFDGQNIGSIGAIALAPSNAATIYVGTGEADMRSDISQGNGVYKSTDAGATWQFIGLPDSQQIAKIVVDPSDANVVYVAALGHPYGPNEQRGVFRSRDGGAHWRKVLGDDSDTGAISIALQPGDAHVMYAALWRTRRPPWNIYPPSNGPGSGLFKSTDGGDHWAQIVGHGFPAKVGRVGISISPAAPQRVYAIVDGDEGGLYRSDDGGANWVRKSADERIWQRGWYFGEIAIDPKNPERIYAMNTIMLRSDDGGANFVAMKGDPTGDDFHAMWIDANDPQRQMLGVDQGALITLNGGKSWSSWHNQPTAQIYHVSTDTRFPFWIYGAQQDSGALSLPSRSGDGNGIGMMQFHEVTAGGESDNIAPDPADPDRVFGGRVEELDLRTQQTRHIDPTLALPDLYRGTWTLPLIFSPRDPHILYFANQRLFRTSDHGEHWAPISPDLTRANPDVPKTLDASAAANNLGQGPRRGVIYAIAPSPLVDGLIWTGTDDGQLWRTDDAGKNWKNLTPPAVGAWSKVANIDASAFDADTAYAAIDRHRLDDQSPLILRTHDGGKSWQSIVSGIATNQSVNVVRADPQRKGLLFAGSEREIWISFDDGDHWQSLKKNLPTTSVRDIAIHDSDIVIATHGRGFWMIDDIASLRQIDEKVENAASWLFAPAPAYRVRKADFTGTPLPKDEPLAANPPDGAYIDYFLKTTAAQPISVEIFDSTGALVRKYSSADKPKAPDPSKNEAAPEWINVPSALSTSAGMHRFVWPLRYPKPNAEKSDPYSAGVWAPPREYKIVFTVGGSKSTQMLTVLADPRVELSNADYAHQFALARQIETQSARVESAAEEAKHVIEALTKSRANKQDATAERIDSALGRAHAIAGSHAASNPHNAWSFPPRSTQTLRFLSESLDKLLQAVDGADAAPSPDAVRGFDALKPLIETTLNAWNDFKSRDLQSINAARQKRGEPLITLGAVSG